MRFYEKSWAKIWRNGKFGVILHTISGRSAVRLAHLLWEQGVEGSNPFTPTGLITLIKKHRPRWRNGRRARFRCECREACRFDSYSGHTNKSQAVNPQLLAIFAFTPCQRGVNRPRRHPSIQPKWMPLTQSE